MPQNNTPANRDIPCLLKVMRRFTPNFFSLLVITLTECSAGVTIRFITLEKAKSLHAFTRVVIKLATQPHQHYLRTHRRKSK